MTTNTSRMWKQLAIVSDGESTLVIAYGLPAFDRELDIDRELDLRNFAIRMAMTELPKHPTEAWADQPFDCSDASMPPLLFSQKFVWQGAYAIN